MAQDVHGQSRLVPVCGPVSHPCSLTSLAALRTYSLRNNILHHAHFQNSCPPSSSYVCLRIHYFYGTRDMCKTGAVMRRRWVLQRYLPRKTWCSEHTFLTLGHSAIWGLMPCLTTSAASVASWWISTWNNDKRIVSQELSHPPVSEHNYASLEASM
jgi:hypothetical protein